MKPSIKIFKPAIIYSIASIDKTGKLIRLASWSNTPERVTAHFQAIIDGVYSYGWKDYASILITSDRLKKVAPVDLTFIIGETTIQDLKEKQDLINNSYIIEYSMQHIYKPYTSEQIKSMSKAQKMRDLIATKLNEASISHMSQMIKILDPK